MPSISSDEKKWRRESDARTLAEAAKIKKDPKRLKEAAKAAEDLAKEASTEANSYRSISNFKSSSKKK